MSIATTPAEPQIELDPRMAAFLSPACSEVFHSVAAPTTIWMADPYDVETIHQEARDAFEHLLNRGNRPSPAPSGAVLVLKGEAGSGKTHLMRAFRTRAHRQGLGYCGYLQMTAEANNYARYMLANLIDSLEHPYNPDGPSRTGLTRLSTGLLELVPDASAAEKQAFRDGESDAALTVDDYADRLHGTSQFRGCDLELMRVMLHLERNESKSHSRALMWLRCQEMRPQDRLWIGDAIPRSDDSDPMRMLQQLAMLVDAIHDVPLVLLIDQLEDMFNQSAPVERFLKVIDSIIAFTDTIPNAVVVVACLEDYFKVNVERLTKSKQDRLLRDPDPIRLLNNRTVAEVNDMTAQRLGYLYDTAGVKVDATNRLYPFSDADLAKLQNMRTRDALHYLQQHQIRCIATGRWEQPAEIRKIIDVNPPPPQALDKLWNDFHSSFQTNVPDDEDELAQVLAKVVAAASVELPEGFHFDCDDPDRRYLEVATCKPDDAIDKLLIAICNAATRGVAFGKQILELEQRAGEIPVAIVRTTDFPKTGNAMKQVGAMLKRHGRTVVVADADWRRMLAFEKFRSEHKDQPDFLKWQKSAKPLSELDSLQKILRLNAMHATSPKGVQRPSEIQPQTNVEPLPVRPGIQVPKDEPTEKIVFGRTQSLSPNAVTFESIEFVQHAAFIGGSGSGKTTAALNLIEQLLARGIPAVFLDRKGDLCRYADPDAWERPLADLAVVEARKALRDKLDIAVYTPGEPNGRPLALPVVPPGFDQLNEADRERFSQYAAAALGSMIGFKASDADKGQRAILANAIETVAAVPRATISVPILREVIQQRDDALLAAIGGGYPDSYYEKLAQRLLTLELNNRQLLSGSEQLDVDALLGTGPHARPGRVRLSVISTRFLGDAAKVDFWVSQLLVAVSRWCAKSPQPRLQALFMFDEADTYLPAGTKQPATKAPMEDLLKRARSAGVSIFLATQSPGDFDYKCKENVRTWVIGRVKETRAIDKLKPLLAAAKADVTGKLPGQSTGEFYLARESSVISVRSERSFIPTEQLPEDVIAELARRTNPN